jgi:hypothetical protein
MRPSRRAPDVAERALHEGARSAFAVAPQRIWPAGNLGLTSSAVRPGRGSRPRRAIPVGARASTQQVVSRRFAPA